MCYPVKKKKNTRPRVQHMTFLLYFNAQKMAYVLVFFFLKMTKVMKIVTCMITDKTPKNRGLLLNFKKLH